MKKSTLIKILVGLALFSVAGLVHIAFNVTGLLGAGGDLRWVNTGRGIHYTLDAAPVFHGSGGTFTLATRDGVRGLTQVGETRFHYSMTLRSPIMVGRGEFTAVSEGDRGRVIHVFDANGRIFSENFDHPVHTFSINSTGFMTAILQLDEGYAIQAFHRNERGGPLYNNRIFPHDNPGIIPVAAEKSENGRYMLYGWLDVNNRLVSRVQLAFTYQGDAWGTDRIFFGRDFEDEMLLHLRMTANNRIVIITDRRIEILTRGLGDVIATTAMIPLYNQLTQLAFDNSGRFAVSMGAAFLNAPDAAAVGSVHIFDANGTRLGVYENERVVTHLSMEHGAVIVGSGRNFTAVNLSGTLLWEFIALSDVRDFFFLENSDTVLIGGPARADVWRRVRNRDGEGDFFGITGQQP